MKKLNGFVYESKQHLFIKNFLMTAAKVFMEVGFTSFLNTRVLKALQMICYTDLQDGLSVLLKHVGSLMTLFKLYMMHKIFPIIFTVQKFQ